MLKKEPDYLGTQSILIRKKHSPRLQLQSVKGQAQYYCHYLPVTSSSAGGLLVHYSIHKGGGLTMPSTVYLVRFVPLNLRQK